MHDTHSENSLVICCTRAGRNGQVKVLAKLGDEIIYVDTFDIDKAFIRTKFAQVVAADERAVRAGVRASDTMRMLDAEACRIAATGAALQDSAENYGAHQHGGRSDEREAKQATALVGLAVAANVDLFKDVGGVPFVSLPVGNHIETVPVKSTGFRRWLSRAFYVANEKVPGAQAVADALAVLEGKALYDGRTCPVHVRLAEMDGDIYLDLANENWQAVKIDAAGWEVVSNPPVKFRRPRAMLALPTPVHGGCIGELRQFVNVVDERDWVLLLAFLVAALRPTGPFPVLALYGEQGSAKTTAARILRALFDPNSAPVRSEPRDVRDLMIAASNGWCVSLENLSSIPVWLSDALCRLSTGGGFSTRELYSDDDEKVFDAKRPVIINGITEVATRPDLLDRAVAITLPTIPEVMRRLESDLWSAFAEAQARILGALLDGVSVALGDLPKTRLDRLPRMADFALWATAAEPGLGLERGAFMAAYAGNQQTVNESAIESCVIAAPLLALLDQRGCYRGFAAQLLDELANVSESEWPNKPLAANLVKGRDWPKKPHVLSGMLRRIAPNLRRIGWHCEFDERDPATRRKIISIARIDTQNSVRCVPAVQTTESQRSEDDLDRSGAFAERSENADKTAHPNAANDSNDVSPVISRRRRAQIQ